jgi:hypothetical protein
MEHKDAMKQKCPHCGKTGKRNCPALETAICSRCCGTKRVSEITCVPECEYNTFGTKAIEAFRDLDNNLFNNLLLPYFRDNGIVSIQEVNRLRNESSGEMDFTNKAHVFFHMRLFHELQPNGKTVFENWHNNGFEKLSHDCQLLLEYKSKAMPTIIELQKNIDANFIECIDIFDKERGSFLLLDPVISQEQFPRFTRVMAWLEDYPVFSRLSAHCETLPDMCANRFIEEIEHFAQEPPYCHAKFPEKQYIFENFEECLLRPLEITEQAANEMLANLDFKTCLAAYDMGNNREKVLEIILSLPDFSENPDAANSGEIYFDWLRRGKSKAIEDNMPEAFRFDDNSEQIGILGNIIIKENNLLLETRSEQKFEFAKQIAQEHFGDMITLEKEIVQDIAKELQNEDSRFDYTGQDAKNDEIPPEIYQELMHKFMDEHYHKFIDGSIPMLDGYTPRQAAKNPQLRPKLLELMKEHIRNNETLASNDDREAYDLSWVLDELGLDELK